MYDNIWTKKFWIPNWVIQIIFAGIFLIIAALALGVVESAKDDYGDDDVVEAHGQGYTVAWDQLAISAGIYIGFTVATLVFNFVEIILYARKRLSPKVAVILSCLTTVIWTLVLALLIVAAVNASSGILSWILVVGLFSTSISKLVYSSTMLYRVRKGRIGSRGAYAPAHPEAGFQAYTAYNAAAAPMPGSNAHDPSRDQSPAPSTAKPFGAAHDHYDPHNSGSSFEMQH